MTHAPPLDLTVARATSRVVAICETDTPLCAALGSGRAALAVICGVDGPSYRPLGAMMVVDENGRAHGNLSSGCIERDVILHARQALADGRVTDAGTPRHTFAGIGLYRPELFASTPAHQPAKLAPLLRAAADQGQIAARLHRGRWEDVGTPERLARLDAELQAA